MQITLYKKCKIGNNYSEVYDTIKTNANGVTPLENYLNSLTKFNLDLEMVYETNSGVLVLELENGLTWKSIYEFNYIKFTQDDFIRYAFIDTIRIQNGVALITYSEDVWHSYYNTMIIKRGNLINSKNLTIGRYKIPIYELPTPYISNKVLSIYRPFLPEYPNTIEQKDLGFCVFVNVQKTKVVQAGEFSERECKGGFIYQLDIASGTSYDWLYEQDLYTILANLVNAQALTIKEGNDTFQYELSDFVILPRCIVGEQLLPYINRTKNIFGRQIQSHRQGNLSGNNASVGICQITDINNSSIFEIISEIKTIKNDFTNVYVGTLGTRIPLANNGADNMIEVRTRISPFEIKVYLDVNGRMVDITNDFTITPPFDSINGSVVAQRKLQKEIANFRNGLTALNLVGNTAQGGFNFYNAEQEDGDIQPFSSMSNFLTSIASIKARDKEINAEVYVNSYVKNSISDIGAFCLWGIILTKLTPDNINEVNQTIDTIGYNVDEIVYNNNIFDNVNNETYDILIFNSVEVYGNFPQNIKNKLETILTRGIRIHYV